MQQPMRSYSCGVNLRSEYSLVLSDLLFASNRCTRIRQEPVYRQIIKYYLMRILSELVFYTINVGIHRLLHGIHRSFILFIEQLFFIFNQMLSIGSLVRHSHSGMKCMLGDRTNPRYIQSDIS